MNIVMEREIKRPGAKVSALVEFHSNSSIWSLLSFLRRDAKAEFAR
jgi:hypothetical protein